MVKKTQREKQNHIFEKATNNWTFSNVYSNGKLVALSGSNFVSSKAGEQTMSKVQPPPLNTSLRNSKYKRKSSYSTFVGQSGVDAQAKRSYTGTPSHFDSFGQIMENVQPTWGTSSSGVQQSFWKKI